MKDVFQTAIANVPHFGSGEVAEILGLEPWELHRVLGRYQLTSSGQLGRGKGSRRWFTTEDVYRIATARFLIRDGFSRQIVSSIVQTLEDRDFYGAHNETGDFSDLGILLRRTNEGPRVEIFRSDSPPELRLEGAVYYALGLDRVTGAIQRRIQEIRKKRGS